MFIHIVKKTASSYTLSEQESISGEQEKRRKERNEFSPRKDALHLTAETSLFTLNHKWSTNTKRGVISNVVCCFQADSSGADSASKSSCSWLWLVDVEQACAFLIGRCLGGMLTGIPLVREEHDCWQWMTSPLFGNGAEHISCDLGMTGG
jgi:hypothetical protein